jgi:halimadienyl-diphosphate synthase
VHSLEFLGKKADKSKLKKAQGPNGSLGNSPATTSYYLSLFPSNLDAMKYLENMIDHLLYPPILYPFETFELTWVLNNLTLSGTHITEFASEQIWEKLKSRIGPSGIGLDPTFGITDGDITAVSSRLLSITGYDVDPKILARFEDSNDHIFRTYNYERNASISTNIHALEAVRTIENYPNLQQVCKQIVLMLLSKRKFNTYWVDKWHASPYYATSHAIKALLDEGAYLANACEHTINWMVHTQHKNGAWGFFEQGTAEETAYVLTALLHYHRHYPIKPDILHRGAAYLQKVHQEAKGNYPPLWIDKCLYTPDNIVHSAVLAALILYSSTF